MKEHPQQYIQTTPNYFDFAELLLDLVGNRVGPGLLSQEVPKDSPDQSVHP